MLTNERREKRALEVELLDPSRFMFKPGPSIDAVVVPCDGKKVLEFAVPLSAELRCPLVVYHDVPHGMTPSTAYDKALAALQAPRIEEVSAVYYRPVRRDEPVLWESLELGTRTHPFARQPHVNGAVPDLRTTAMTELKGAQRVVFLDDDTAVEMKTVMAASLAMELHGYTANGFFVPNDWALFEQHQKRFPSFIHSHLGEESEKWVPPPSGSAILINLDKYGPYSEGTYDEDSKNVYEILRHEELGGVSILGTADQQDSLDFSERAIFAQSAGEVLAEGASYEANPQNDAKDPNFWAKIIKLRVTQLDELKLHVQGREIRGELSEHSWTPSEMDTFWADHRSLRESFAQYIGEEDLFVDYFQCWVEDIDKFQDWRSRQPDFDFDRFQRLDPTPILSDRQTLQAIDLRKAYPSPLIPVHRGPAQLQPDIPASVSRILQGPPSKVSDVGLGGGPN